MAVVLILIIILLSMVLATELKNFIKVRCTVLYNGVTIIKYDDVTSIEYVTLSFYCTSLSTQLAEKVPLWCYLAFVHYFIVYIQLIV